MQPRSDPGHHSPTYRRCPLPRPHSWCSYDYPCSHFPSTLLPHTRPTSSGPPVVAVETRRRHSRSLNPVSRGPNACLSSASQAVHPAIRPPIITAIPPALQPTTRRLIYVAADCMSSNSGALSPDGLLAEQGTVVNQSARKCDTLRFRASTIISRVCFGNPSLHRHAISATIATSQQSSNYGTVSRLDGSFRLSAPASP